MHELLQRNVGNIVERYVDDLVSKHDKEEITWNTFKRCSTSLEIINQRWILLMRFWIISCKFMGFVVRHMGIKIDSRKIKATWNSLHKKIFENSEGYKRSSYIYKNSSQTYLEYSNEIVFLNGISNSKRIGRYEIISHKTPDFCQPNKHITPHIVHYGSITILRALLVQENSEIKKRLYVVWVELNKPKRKVFTNWKGVLDANIRQTRITALPLTLFNKVGLKGESPQIYLDSTNSKWSTSKIGSSIAPTIWHPIRTY